MNREILFRGKRFDNGEWVEGFYVYRPDGKHLIYWKPFDDAKQNTYHIVTPETVGQFTGLTDKNGKRIFEGDIDQNNDVVMWCEKRNGWAMKIYDFPTKEVISCHCYQCDGDFEISDIDSDIEVIGNIHDKTK